MTCGHHTSHRPASHRSSDAIPASAPDFISPEFDPRVNPNNIMSQSRASSVVSQNLVFEEDRLETYSMKELKAVCKNLKVQIRGLTKKEELQKALRASVAARTASGQSEDPNGESTDTNSRDDVLRVQELPGGDTPCAKQQWWIKRTDSIGAGGQERSQ
ncbi:hypothetical protein NDU88_002011 [Pleurodeles waltl]|uniref:SAP domain-containing protein n=1 Tax=Pleurodeles waltl TaxID=8319 RepID=A0AAV7T1P4_PLEWA|nr:hypothetical protein NDU88_002011 [Pleurodeles waltl]